MVQIIPVFKVARNNSVDGLGRYEHVAYLTSKSEAEKLVPKESKYSDTIILSEIITIFDTAEEFNNKKPLEELKKSGLAKLTQEEKIALKLSDL